MKKMLLLPGVALLLSLSSCLTGNLLGDNTTDGRYRTENGQTPPPPPPGDNRGNNGYNNNYNNGNRPPQDNYGNSRGGYYNNNNNRGYYNRPAVGTSVTVLPSNAQRITSGGQELYVSNGVMYQPVRSRSGVTYRVVGYRDNY